jgi:hypothetical protein
MRKFPLFLMLLALLVTLTAVAQQNTTQPTTTTQPNANSMSGPPKVLSIIREEVKPGKAFLHNQHEAAWTQALVKANYGTHMLAITSVTGPSEDWFLVGFDSYADLEKDNENLEKNAALRNIMTEFMPKESDFLSEARMITARYKPELSYQADFKLGEFRYFTVGILRMKMGHDLSELGKILAAARTKANLDRHVVAYEVNSGMPTGTYLFFSPVKSLAKWDEPPNAAYSEALKEANFMSAAEKDVMSYEERLYSFNPKLSYVPEQVAAADPEFWHPKAEVASTPATHKTTPAAKKETKKATSAKNE